MPWAVAAKLGALVVISGPRYERHVIGVHISTGQDPLTIALRFARFIAVQFELLWAYR